ncbi:MAG: peptide ABC transporter substrate-binding protein [Anaerolineae bacterium]|nr:peptide ABC transporter substrate-binding protein [Anaerolineae bacterium]
MFDKKYLRILGISMVFVTILSLLVGVAQAQDESVVVIGWEQEPDVMPPLSTSTFSQLLRDFFSRNVWDWDTDFNIYPIMVTEIPTVENGMVTTNEAGNTVVTYKLREGMKWSDGEAITTDDCLFGHKLYSDTSTGSIFRSDYPSVVESVEKIDDLTVVQTFNTPYPDYTSDTVYLQCRYPEHVLQPLIDANGGTVDGLPYFTRAEGMVGYGPYMLESWTPGDNITFVPNPNWDGQAPAIQRVITKFITETAQMQNAFETGEIDVTFNWPIDLVPTYSAVEGAEVWNVSSVYQDALWFNTDPEGTQNPAIKDPNVRKAIIHAIDRAALVESLVAPGLLPPDAFDAVKWRPEGLEVLGYDVDEANRLLDEAGWVDSNGDGSRDKDGVELILRFYTTTLQTRGNYQLAIQEYLTAVGIRTQLFQVPGPAVLFASVTNRGIMSTGDYDISIYASSNDPVTPNIDPDSFSCAGRPSAENPSGGNFSFICNERLDELISAIRSNVDPVSRLEQKHETVQILNDQYFWAGLYPRVTNYAAYADRFDTSTMKALGTLASNYFQKIEFWLPL